MKVFSLSRSATKGFPQKQEGAIAPIFAMCSLVLFLCIGSALDFARTFRDRDKAQNGLDAAILAMTTEIYNLKVGDLAALNGGGDGALYVHDKLRETGISYLQANGVTIADPANQVSFDFNQLSRNEFQVTGKVKSNTKSTLMNLGGYAKIDWVVTSSSSVSLKIAEITLLLDVSWSMRPEDMAAMTEGASMLIDRLFPDGPNNRIVVSLIPFADGINFGDQFKDWLEPDPNLRFPNEFSGCFRPEFDVETQQMILGQIKPGHYQPMQQSAVMWRRQERYLCPGKGSEVLLFQNDPDLLKQKLGNLEQGWGTGTNIAFAWGWRSLAPVWRGVFPVSKTYPQGFNEVDQKNLILFTDGRPTLTDPEGDGIYEPAGHVWSGKQSQDFAAASFRDLCQQIKRSNRKNRVFTIGYQLDPTKDTEITADLKNCATDPENFYTGKKDNLETIFNSIANEIIKIKLES